MQKVNEVEALIVGTKYLVPCTLNPYGDWLPGQWIPILYAKESHSDPELTVHTHHLHYDTRFISGHKLLIGHGVCLAATRITGLYRPYTFDQLVALGEITWRSRKCYRAEQLLPQTKVFQVSVVDKIKDSFKDQNIHMENMICPHRGTCLKSHPVKEFHQNQKGITCPAHGLSWNIETGCLIE